VTSIPQSKFVVGLLFAYTLSEAQFFWFAGTVDVFLYWIKKIALFYIVIHVANDKKSIKRIYWAVSVAVIVVCYNGWDIYLYKPYLLPHPERLQSLGNYNNPNSLSFLLTLAFPIAFFLMEVESNIIKKVLLLCSLILFGATCLYTKSRGGNLGMLASVGLCFVFSKKIIRSKILAFTMVGLTGMFFLGHGITIVLDRQDVHEYRGDSSSGDRLLAWSAGLRMFKEKPLFGVGWNKFSENVRNYGHDKKLIAHNTMISVLAETGILGFTCFIIVLFLTFKQLFHLGKRWQYDEHKQDIFLLSRGVLISLICFLINSSFSTKDHEPIYWVILSLAGAFCVIYHKEKTVTLQIEV
jgi:O-antigen ligase